MSRLSIDTVLTRMTLMVAAFAFAGAAAAQTYPSKAIRLVVGFPPGGGVDIVARLIGVELQKTLGQAVIVENRAGAGGSLAADLVAKSPGDGYTLLMGNTGSLTINPSLYAKVGYNTLHDFAPVALVSTSPLVMVANPSLPATSLADVLALAKKRADAMTFGTGGNGSIAHLTVELLKARTGVAMTHIPYKGGSPAIVDLLSDQIQVVVEGVPLVAPFVNQKKLKAVVITSSTRSPVLPDVPTVIEAGFPDLVITAWYGIVAPASTPPEIVAQLNKAINAAVAQQAFRAKLTAQGGDPAGGTPAQFGDLLKKEMTRWALAVKASGAKVE